MHESILKFNTNFRACQKEVGLTDSPPRIRPVSIRGKADLKELEYVYDQFKNGGEELPVSIMMLNPQKMEALKEIVFMVHEHGGLDNYGRCLIHLILDEGDGAEKSNERDTALEKTIHGPPGHNFPFRTLFDAAS